MNNKLRHTTIFEGAVCSVVLAFKLIEANCINLRLAFVVSISSIQPKSTRLDYIEAKKTMGARQISPASIQIPLFHNLTVRAMLLTATCDLTQHWSNAAKLINRSINSTFEMNVKGLIELMYQFFKCFRSLRF